MTCQRVLRPLIIGALCVCSVAVAAAAGAPASHGHVTAWPKGHYASLDALPDWGGIWFLNFSMPKPGSKPSQPELKGKYLKDHQKWLQEVKANHGEVLSDTSHCTPPGMPMIMMIPQYPIEFLFTPGKVTTQHEAWMQWRVIYTDGRSHPKDLEPTFNGNSIGHWEGNTLVVDTVGIKQSVDIGRGMEHSPKLRIVERIHLAKGDPNTLVDELTIHDPLALKKPWTTKLTFKRNRTENLLEYICEENNRNPVNASGQTEFE